MIINRNGHILSAVSGATTVPVELLLENEDFLEAMDNLELSESDLIEWLTNWVNENY